MMSAGSLSRSWQVLAVLWLCGITLTPSTAHPSDSGLTISLNVPLSFRSEPVVTHAVADTASLLARAFPSARILHNNRHADIVLQLPECVQQTEAGKPSGPHLPVPDRSHAWQSSRRGSTTVMKLAASTPEGVACGLYHLLQEKLKVHFLHPRQTLIPRYKHWPLSADIRFAGRPLFTHHGFHLHTLHPLELTEQLHNPQYPRAFEDITAYLDWLARNNQNIFQFFLLRGVDRTDLIPHLQRIIAYAHSRGIRCGVEISLAMLQQQAFQAITLLRLYPSYRRQVDDTLAWLFQAPWDFVSLEPMMGEHLPLIGRLLPGAQERFEKEVLETYQRPLFLATHVIRHEGGKEDVRRPICDKSGILIHTVMCYSASEARAPVYGNDNQRFMLQAAREENARRETWYWPESSYWVGFDSPVPLLLLPYLDSRLDDIGTMHRFGISGHLTFSSGWEWGYWLIDWSIARWSWALTEGGRPVGTTPLTRLGNLLHDPVMVRFWQQSLDLQNRYLKQKELLRFMAASTPFSELPPPFDLPFQPSPPFRYPWLMYDASVAEVSSILQVTVTDLNRYAQEMTRITEQMTHRINQLHRERYVGRELFILFDELITALQMTALRASHRALILQALAARHRTLLGGKQQSDRFLTQAAAIRLHALELVRKQESRYRYPVTLLAERRASLTTYPFGYLYPVASLFFWEREEGQVRHERFDPFFMNLWDIRKTLGLESLFTH